MFFNRFVLGSLMDPTPGAGGGGSAIDETKVNEMINGAVNRMVKDELPKFFTEQMKPFNTQFTTIADTLKGFQTTLTGLKPVPVEPTKEELEKGITPEVKGMLKRLEDAQKVTNDQLATEKKLREEAQAKSFETDKQSKVRTALGGYDFVTPEAAEDAFQLIHGQVQVDEATGNLIAGGLPLSDYVTDAIMTKRAHLLKPVGKGGSGASGGSTKQGQGGFDIDKIHSGMTDAERAQAAGAIARALANK